MEYSEASEVVGPARYNLNTTKRSLEDRVRDYTGHSLRQDERLDHPAGSSSGRSSDSRSPFLEGQGTRHKRRGGGGGGREMMMSDQYETPHIPQTLRGDTHTIWETKLDQGMEQTGTPCLSSKIRPSKLFFFIHVIHQSQHCK